MTDSPRLSDEEWALVIELLEHEHDQLPMEIHHCRVASFRDDLRRRHATVQKLLERLHQPATA